jgi:hypothetical protein
MVKIMFVATPRITTIRSSEGVRLAVEDDRGGVQVQAEAEAKRSGAMHAIPIPLHACCCQPRRLSGATNPMLSKVSA